MPNGGFYFIPSFSFDLTSVIKINLVSNKAICIAKARLCNFAIILNLMKL